MPGKPALPRFPNPIEASGPLPEGGLIPQEPRIDRMRTHSRRLLLIHLPGSGTAPGCCRGLTRYSPRPLALRRNRSAGFFTRVPRLAFLRDLIAEQALSDYNLDDLSRVFKAVDAHCARFHPAKDRGDWFPPVMLGGCRLNHTPTHIIFAAYAIYADRAWGRAEPVAFLSAPLDLQAATAVRLPPSHGFQVLDGKGRASPMTDILLLIPARIRPEWVQDFYGVPDFRPTIVPLGWHMAAESSISALGSGMLFLDGESRRVLNPMADIGAEDEALFFAQPVTPAKLDRCRERLGEFFDVPVAVLTRNHETAKRVLEAYFARQGPAPDRPDAGATSGPP